MADGGHRRVVANMGPQTGCGGLGPQTGCGGIRYHSFYGNVFHLPIEIIICLLLVVFINIVIRLSKETYSIVSWIEDGGNN